MKYKLEKINDKNCIMTYTCPYDGEQTVTFSVLRNCVFNDVGQQLCERMGYTGNTLSVGNETKLIDVLRIELNKFVYDRKKEENEFLG